MRWYGSWTVLAILGLLSVVIVALIFGGLDNCRGELEHTLTHTHLGFVLLSTTEGVCGRTVVSAPDRGSVNARYGHDMPTWVCFTNVAFHAGLQC